MRLLLTTIAIFALSAGAIAQEQSAAEPAKPSGTRIVADEGTNVIRFFIEGVEQARLTSDGLLVRGNVEYGGIMRDAGAEVLEEPNLENE